MPMSCIELVRPCYSHTTSPRHCLHRERININYTWLELPFLLALIYPIYHLSKCGLFFSTTTDHSTVCNVYRIILGASQISSSFDTDVPDVAEKEVVVEYAVLQNGNEFFFLLIAKKHHSACFFFWQYHYSQTGSQLQGATNTVFCYIIFWNLDAKISVKTLLTKSMINQLYCENEIHKETTFRTQENLWGYFVFFACF